MYGPRDFRPGDLVWFDPGVGYVLPGEVLEFHKAAQVINSRWLPVVKTIPHADGDMQLQWNEDGLAALGLRRAQLEATAR